MLVSLSLTRERSSGVSSHECCRRSLSSFKVAGRRISGLKDDFSCRPSAHRRRCRLASLLALPFFRLRLLLHSFLLALLWSRRQLYLSRVKGDLVAPPWRYGGAALLPDCPPTFRSPRESLDDRQLRSAFSCLFSFVAPVVPVLLLAQWERWRVSNRLGLRVGCHRRAPPESARTYCSSRGVLPPLDWWGRWNPLAAPLDALVPRGPGRPASLVVFSWGMLLALPRERPSPRSSPSSIS